MGNILNIINSDKNFYDTHNGHYMRCVKGAFYSSELKEHFKVNEVDVDNIDENTNYIYLIECVTQDAIYSGFFKLPQKVLDLVNQNRCKVIFSYEAEGDLDIEFFNEWYSLTCKPREDEIKFSNFYVLHCELTCEKNNKTPINFFNSTHHFDSLSFELNKIIENDNHRKLDKFNYDFYRRKSKDINIDNKSKHFLCYLRNCGRPHRNAIASYFQHNNLWDNNNLSFLKNSFRGDIPKDILPQQYWNSSVELNDLPKVELDTQNLQDTQGFDTSFSSNWKHYQETFLSIVSETIYEDKSKFFSEKICKPLVNLHPFILMSTPYSLRYLKKFGFKTFDGFIDESYDKEENDLKRMQMIFDELDKFRSKSNEELKNWWSEILPILEHNQETFINMGNKKTKKIKLLEKLYD
jgi:hypothetical protein|tara:strand:+ start:523 stop:1746 length:1224 start_codon:yes stop_codon:yes gene_type:complete